MPKTRDEWANVVAKHYLLAELVRHTFRMYKLIPWYDHKLYKTTHYTVSFSDCRSFRQLTIKEGNKSHLFKIPIHPYLSQLSSTSAWFDSSPMYLTGARYPKYFMAKAILFNEIMKNIKNLYWKNKRVAEVESPEQWIIEHELNMPHATNILIELLVYRIEDVLEHEKSMNEPLPF